MDKQLLHANGNLFDVSLVCEELLPVLLLRNSQLINSTQNSFSVKYMNPPKK